MPGKNSGTKPNSIRNQLPEDSMRKTTDVRNIMFPVLIGLVFLIAYAFIFDTKVDLNGDNASYFALGKALATGQGYVDIATLNHNPENHFPPGYPFLISWVIRIFGESINIVKIFNGIYIMISIILLYFITDTITGNKSLGLVVALLLSLNYHLLQYSTIMMSEASFILCTSLSIWTVIKLREDKNIFTQPALYISFICLIISYYIRSTGLALLGGICLWFLLQKNWKAVVFYLSGFVLAALPWSIRSRHLGGNSYLQPLVMINPYRPDLGNAGIHDYVNRILSNISRYISREIPTSIFPFIKVDYLEKISAGEWLTGMIIAGLILLGLIRLKKFRIFIIACLAANFAILFLWPEVWTGVRFILPVTPILMIGLLHGTVELFHWLSRRSNFKLTVSPWIFLIIVLLLINPLKDLHKKATDEYSPNWKNYFELAKWMKRQDIENAVVCCRKTSLFYLYSGTYTTSFPYTENDQEIISNLIKDKVTHVVLDNLGYRQTYVYLLPAIRKNPQHFEVVMKLSDPDTYLLKFKP